MLMYDWTLDPHHTFIRVCLILEIASKKRCQKIEYDRLRILDFILAKPTFIADIRCDNAWGSSVKSDFRKLKNDYNQFPKQSLFENMKNTLNTVLAYLESTQVIASDKSTRPSYLITFDALSKNLLDAINSQTSINQKAISLVHNHLIDYQLMGVNGLKDRTELMEYRYDNI